MRALTPACLAAQATACPWLPALAATTPASRSLSVSVASRLTAPRTLNAPVRWRFSAFSQTSRPAIRENVSELYTGVSRATPAMRSRASRMSAGVGAVSVFNVEHLLHDLAYGGERVELPSLNLVEEPPKLGIVGHGLLQMNLGPRRGDREDFTCEVPAAPLVEEPVGLEVLPVAGDLLPELHDSLARDGLREDDRRLPVALGVEGEDRPHLVQHRLRCRVVLLVDGDDVRDLHDPRLQRLHRVTRTGHEDEDDRVGDSDHLDLTLPGADRLEEDQVTAGCVEHEQGLQRGLGEPAEVPSGAHRADEDAGVEEMVRQPDPIAEESALRERARGVDGDHADRLVLFAHVSNERADQA